MSQRDGFSSGFLLGTIVGGVVGGVVGALLATRQFGESTATEEAGLDALPADAKSTAKPTKRKSLFKAAGDRSDIEGARRSLEDKIAQLNEAIDDVRQQLGGVNGPVLGEADPHRAKEPHRQN